MIAKPTVLFLLGAWLALSPPAAAALVNEGEYTLDTSTGVEWLNPTLTFGLSYDAVVAGAGGWAAAGWQYATSAQFYQLATDYVGGAASFYNPTGAFDEVSVGNGPSYFAGAFNLVNALGVTNSLSIPGGVYEVSAGLVVPPLGQSVSYIAGVYAISYENTSEWFIDAEFSPTSVSPGVGSYLVKDPPAYVQPIMPEPVITPALAPETSAWLMMLLGFAGLGYAGYRRAKVRRAG